MPDDRPSPGRRRVPAPREFLVTFLDEWWGDHKGRGMSLARVVAAESKSYRNRFRHVTGGGVPAEEFVRREPDLGDLVRPAGGRRAPAAVGRDARVPAGLPRR